MRATRGPSPTSSLKVAIAGVLLSALVGCGSAQEAPEALSGADVPAELPSAEVGAQPSWSKRGLILYVKQGAIWAVLARGTGARRVTKPGVTAWDSSPTWSPTAESLVFARLVFRQGRAGSRLMYMAMPSGIPRLVSQRIPGTASDPSWSPGRDIVFAASCRELGFIRPTGADLRIAPQPALSCLSSPTWSPRGDSVVYAASGIPPGESSLYRVSGKGDRRVRLTSGANDVTPDWSPDGTSIVFSRNCRVAILDLHAKSVRYVGKAPRTPRCQTDPAWSPNGKWIVYSVRGRLVVVRPDGRSAREIAR